MRFSSLLLSASALSLSVFASLAHAEEAGNASLVLNLPVLSYGSSNQEVKPDGGTSAKSKSSSMVTGDLGDSYAQIAFGSCNMTFFPFSGAKMISLGYLPTPMFEVGLDLGLNSDKIDKPKDESNSTLIGLYGFVYPKLGTMDSEVGLIIDSTTTKGTKMETTGTTETEVKSNSTRMDTKILGNVIVPLRKNLSYVGGFWYKMANDNDKEAKSKTVESGFGLNVATMRITLD